MSPRLENLRLSVGLAHAVAGAELKIRNKAGAEYTASTHASADIDLCGLRHAVIASTCPSRPDLSHWARCIEIGGALSQRQAGIYRADANPFGEWWFATLLRPERVVELLDCLSNAVSDDDGEALLKPDLSLGMTAVSVLATAPRQQGRLFELATELYQACLVDELILRTRTPPDNTGPTKREVSP